MVQIFEDRRHAGQVLAEHLGRYAGRDDVQVLGLPRGGVPVAFEVAQALGAPLDVFVVRKLGTPGHEEFAMGAIASGGITFLNESVVTALRIPKSAIDNVTQREQRELERRERLYRGDRPLPDLGGRTVILVDDGLATGSSMRAAVQALRRLQPARIVVAVPTGAPDTCRALEAVADEVVCASTPEPFQAVGLWYRDFTQVGDDEVRALLEQGQAGSAKDPDRAGAR